MEVAGIRAGSPTSRKGRWWGSWTLLELHLAVSEGFNRANPLRPRTARPGPRGGPRGGGRVPAGAPPGREPLLLNGGPCASRRVSAIPQSALAGGRGHVSPTTPRALEVSRR